MRYAVERQRAVRSTSTRPSGEAENTRVERALTPTPVIRSDDITLPSATRPGREGSELGGDFYDAVETVDGRSTSSWATSPATAPTRPPWPPASAAPGGAWPWRVWQMEVVDTLDGFIRTEWDTITFATVCTLDDQRRPAARPLVLAGHPPPILTGDRSRAWARTTPGRCWVSCPSPVAGCARALEPGATLLLYTDGLIEGWSSPGATTAQRG